MRFLDALSALDFGKTGGGFKTVHFNRLSTVWSEEKKTGQVLPEYPRPQFRREDWVCLNGLWDYAFTKDKEYPREMDGQILVPFSPESRRSGVGRRLEPGEYLWYSREVSVPDIPAGKRLLLHFGAVDQRCSVWWNGKLAGSHQNGYLAFSFDVTEYLKEGGNRLCVCVQDDTDTGFQCRGKQSLNPHGMFYSAQSGIWQTVWMEWVPKEHIEELKITPLFDEGAVRFEITLTSPDHLLIFMAKEDEYFYHHVRRREFPEGSSTIVREIALPDFRAWSPEDPYLYDVCITTSADSVQSYFAMRKFSVGIDGANYPRLMLNNQPYFFHGVLDQGYWPESLYTPPDDEAMVYDIQKMKELGFNTLRKHLKVEPMRWYYHCDRLGMVVWQDMVSGGGKILMPLMCYLPTLFPAVGTRLRDNHYSLFSRASRKGRRQWEEDCISTVEQLYNCPCIGLWTLFNEGWGQFDALRITKKIRKADKTRLIDHASGWFDQGGGDIRSVHNYFRPLRVMNDRRPFVLSEYGGYTCSVPEHQYCSRSYGYRTYKTEGEYDAAFKALMRDIRELQKEGLSGAVYTQLSDVEEEINGILTYDRKVCKLRQAELS